MTFLTESKRAILGELWHGPLNHFEIGEATGIAPFTVRAELQDLRRERLVLEHLSTSGHTWELTNHAYSVLSSPDQLTLS